MDMIILAGDSHDPAEWALPANQNRKAFIELRGKPSLQHMLDAASKSARIGRIVVVGFTDRKGFSYDRELMFVDGRGTLVENAAAAIERLKIDRGDETHVLITGSDVPLITPEALDWHVNAIVGDRDLYYTVIRKEEMLEAFPTAKRTWARLREGTFCSGDLHAFCYDFIDKAFELWSNLAYCRKKPVQLARTLGFGTFIKALLGRLTVAEIERVFLDKFGLNAMAVVTPFPEVAMDIDKPEHVAVVEAHLSAADA